MQSSVLIDGRRRSIVCTREYRLGMSPGNAGKKFPAEIYSREEVDRLMAKMGRGATGARNRAITAVMRRSGLRVAEALALQVKDVDLASGTLVVLHGKGNRRRTVGIDQETVALLEVWLEHRRALRPPAGSPLFCVISRPTIGKPIYSSTIREMLKRAAVKAGVEKRVHPHGLRHTFAVELMREGVPTPLIKKALGHSSLDTTERYLDHLEPAAVVEMMRRRASHDGPPPLMIAS